MGNERNLERDLDHIERLAEWEINQVRARVPRAGGGQRECRVCDEPLPRQRIAWGYTLCVACAELLERQR